MRHCDEIIDDTTQPQCLRDFLHYHRLPAVCQCADMDEPMVELAKLWIAPENYPYIWTKPEPQLFADYEGYRVRAVMASRFGDVGITRHLDRRRGYEKRVMVEELTKFSETI